MLWDNKMKATTAVSNLYTTFTALWGLCFRTCYILRHSGLTRRSLGSNWGYGSLFMPHELVTWLNTEEYWQEFSYTLHRIIVLVFVNFIVPLEKSVLYIYSVLQQASLQWDPSPDLEEKFASRAVIRKLFWCYDWRMVPKYHLYFGFRLLREFTLFCAFCREHFTSYYYSFTRHTHHNNTLFDKKLNNFSLCWLSRSMTVAERSFHSPHSPTFSAKWTKSLGNKNIRTLCNEQYMSQMV